ncbi:MAG: hypothetical protein V4764_07065 [Burkholderia sp.]
MVNGGGDYGGEPESLRPGCSPGPTRHSTSPPPSRTHDGTRTLPIALHQVGSLDDTGNAPRLTGTVEIPMWHHTPKHLLLGVYTSSPACPLSMSRLRLVNLATGHIDREIPFKCGTGTVSTPIYANVYRANDPRHVTVIFQGGFHGMGDDREIKIEP